MVLVSIDYRKNKKLKKLLKCNCINCIKSKKLLFLKEPKILSEDINDISQISSIVLKIP